MKFDETKLADSSSARIREADYRTRRLQHAVECGQCDPNAAEQEIMMLAIAATVSDAQISGDIPTAGDDCSGVL
jgi:hypothetical protein